jgi:protein N-terminal amidase
METLAYWLARLEPIIRAESVGEVIVVMANRCGTEEEAVYAGTSAVLGITEGEVKVYGILGRGEKELLVVDTSKRPQAKLISEPNSAASTATASTSMSNDTEVSASTECTSPDIEERYQDFEGGFSPISPVDAKRSQSYFDSKHSGEDQSPTQPLHSSAARVPVRSPTPQLPSTSPELSPTFNRPASPKSRNASRTRNREDEEPALAFQDLAQEPQVNKPSPIKSPPFSASAVPDMYQSTFTSDSLGPRSRHVSPRPKSAIW